jgi:hypothetical protein
LQKIRGGGDRGMKHRGKEGLESHFASRTKGGTLDENGWGRVEDREEPSAATSVQTGHKEQKTSVNWWLSGD